MIFGRRSARSGRRPGDKSTVDQTPAAGDGESAATVIRTPPMRPFARTSAPLNLAPRQVPAKPVAPIREPASAVVTPSATLPRRPAEIAARPVPRRAASETRPIPGHTLVVGRDIRLTGEIRACERLIVEGSVEAELTDTHTLEIAESGHFRGSAAVGECVVSGTFDGDLTVSGLLAVRAGGRVGGAVRYAEIEVERGGRITGRADLQGPQEVRPAAHPAEPRPNGGPGLRPA